MRAVRTRFAGALVLVAAAGWTAAAAAQAPQASETFEAAWRIVRDSHFDPNLNGVDWSAVRTELGPRAAAARSVGELRAVLREMLGRLGQSHFAVIPGASSAGDDEPGGGAGSPGFDVRLAGGDLIVTEVEPGGAAAASGVRTGWKLIAADGLAAGHALASLPDSLTPRLRHVEAWRLVQNRLRGPVGSTARLTFEDGAGEQMSVQVPRGAESGQPVTVGSLPTMFVRLDSRVHATPAGRSAALVRFNVWMTAVDGPFQRAVDAHRRSDGFIIDLRGNPGGLAAMLMGIAGHFIDERLALGVMKLRDNELRFNVNPRRVSAGGERVEPFAGPVAILVDGLSGSASECFAGGMQSVGRARVFGQRTMGQALPALFSRLPNGDVLIHAYADFVTADGTRLEGRGVIPDEELPLDRSALLAGRDPVLEAALAWIDRAGRPRP